MYFMDTGLCAYLSRWNSAENLEISSMAGAFFENFVVTEIIKSYLNTGRRPPVYYYRDTEKREIDLLLEENGTTFPIEIKMTANPGKKDFRNFNLLSTNGLKLGPGNVICMCSDLIPADADNTYVPAWMV